MVYIFFFSQIEVNMRFGSYSFSCTNAVSAVVRSHATELCKLALRFCTLQRAEPANDMIEVARQDTRFHTFSSLL